MLKIVPGVVYLRHPREGSVQRMNLLHRTGAKSEIDNCVGKKKKKKKKKSRKL